MEADTLWKDVFPSMKRFKEHIDYSDVFDLDFESIANRHGRSTLSGGTTNTESAAKSKA